MASPESPEPLVWYLAYGSNLSFARFMTYLAGGTPEGKSTAEAGAADPSPPRASRPFHLGHGLYFAGEATSWGGGGVAFLRAEEEPGALTYARIYLITVNQLRAVLAQENGLDPSRGAALVSAREIATAEPGTRIDTGAGEYGLLLCVGREPVRSGGPIAPIWTFTTAQPLDGRERQPSDAYLATICRGLLETFWALPPSSGGEAESDRLSLRTLEAYLSARLGPAPGPESPAARVRRLFATATQGPRCDGSTSERDRRTVPLR
jgi:hypothetical protein